MKTNIEAISYSSHILLPFILLKTEYVHVEFTNLEMKIKS